MNKLLRLVIVVSSFILVSCVVAPKQMYDGPRLAPESEAVLIGDVGSLASHGEVYITHVDGKSALGLAALLAGQMFPYPFGVFILPGYHEISTKFVGDVHSYGLIYLIDNLIGADGVVDGKLQFHAEAGKTYFIRATWEGSSVSFWIEDTSTGHAVEGIDQDKSTH